MASLIEVIDVRLSMIQNDKILITEILFSLSKHHYFFEITFIESKVNVCLIIFCSSVIYNLVLILESESVAVLVLYLSIIN